MKKYVILDLRDSVFLNLLFPKNDFIICNLLSHFFDHFYLESIGDCIIKFTLKSPDRFIFDTDDLNEAIDKLETLQIYS